MTLKVHVPFRIRLEYHGQVLCETDTAGMPAEIAIGRGSECDWRTPEADTKVSRRHAILRRTAEGLVVRDAGSRNGILVEGRRVEEQLLGVGAVVYIGDCILTVMAVRASPRVPARAVSLIGQTHNFRGRAIPIDTDVFRIGFR